MIADDPAHSLLIQDASASPLTMKIMTVVLCIFLPIMLAYFIWSYFIQRKRLDTDGAHLTSPVAPSATVAETV